MILIVHPGFDDGTSWQKVAALLSRRFRVIRPLRKQYRPAEKAGCNVTVTDEADELRAIVEAVDDRTMLVGHSSGGIVALETLVARPSSSILCAAIYDCQSARNGDPGSACKRDPFVGCDGERPTGWSWSGLRSPVGRVDWALWL